MTIAMVQTPRRTSTGCHNAHNKNRLLVIVPPQKETNTTNTGKAMDDIQVNAGSSTSNPSGVDGCRAPG
eukprot:5458419-Prorocentrum_lima.AAC.1